MISENPTALNTHTNLEEARAAAVRDGIPNTVEAGKSMVKICVTVDSILIRLPVDLDLPA